MLVQHPLVKSSSFVSRVVRCTDLSVVVLMLAQKGAKTNAAVSCPVAFSSFPIRKPKIEVVWGLDHGVGSFRHPLACLCVASLCPSMTAHSFSVRAIRGRTPLHVAARHDHLDCLDELLASGSDKAWNTSQDW